jgi:ribosomal protein S18 acetylase RimI-like enzyme
VRIREATVADIDAIAATHVEAWRAAYPGLVPQPFLDAIKVDGRRDLWKEHFLDPKRGALVVEDELGIAGFASYGPAELPIEGSSLGEILGIYLLPRVIGMGVGRDLLARATRALTEDGYDRAVLWVLEANTRARRFYEAAGWRSDGTVHQQAFGEETRPVVRYRRELEPRRRSRRG